MKNLYTTIGVNEFVKRQIKGSGKTYSNTLSFEDIAEHATKQLAKGYYKEGYREGVILAKVDPSLINNYICPFVKIDENSKLQAKMVRRRPEEEPYIQIRALNGIPLKTGSVDILKLMNIVQNINGNLSLSTPSLLISQKCQWAQQQ